MNLVDFAKSIVLVLNIAMQASLGQNEELQKRLHRVVSLNNIPVYTYVTTFRLPYYRQQLNTGVLVLIELTQGHGEAVW